MTDSVGFTFFSKNLVHIDSALTTHISSVTSNIITGITPVSNTLLTLFVLWWGWSMMRGLIQEPWADGVSRISRLIIIYSLATNIGLYNDFLADWLWKTPESLARIVSSDSVSSYGFNYLDTLLSKFYDKGLVFWEKGGSYSPIPDIGFYIIALMVWIFGLALTVYAAFLLVLSKMALAVLLGIGPIFVLLLMFEPTKKFFDQWIGQVINFVFLATLTGSTVKLSAGIIDKYIAVMSNAADIVEIFPLIGLSAISVLVLMQMPSIASSLGGGVAISSLGAFGAATKPISNAGKAAAGKVGSSVKSVAQPVTRPVLAVLNRPIKRSSTNSIKN
jgi:type IV secretion system protein VirB6